MTNHGLLVGYDGSPDAAGAIELGARLLPSRDVRIAHLWAEPFAAAELRPRLSKRTETVREMIELLEQEAAAEAERIAAEGVVLGSRRWARLAHVVLGSVSESVVRKSTCPTLVVPRRRRNAVDDDAHLTASAQS